jgi:predicted Zn-dependent protease
MVKQTCLLILTIMAMGLMSGCASVDFVTGKQVNNMYSLTDDIRLGADIQKQIRSEMEKKHCPADKDPAQVRKLNEMVARITAVSHLTNLPYEVTLFQTNIPNAMAAPGGKVIVFEGLYHGKEALATDDDELAFVLAHEIAHVNCRHSTEEMTRQMPMTLVTVATLLYAEQKKDRKLQGWAAAGFLVYQGLIITKYSRDDEREADRVGLKYMARAGYDPRAAARMWKRLDQADTSKMSMLNWLSTHPTHEARYKELEKQLPEVLPLYYESRKAGRGDQESGKI